MDVQDRIRRAFLDLAEEEDNLRKITTTQILKRAGVSRSTFYSYYENKEDLMRDVLSIIIWEMAVSIRDVFPSKQGLESYRSAYLIISREIYRHKRLFFQIIKNARIQNDILDASVKYVEMQYEEMQAGQEMPRVPENVSRLAAVGTNGFLYSLLCDWARRGYVETPEEITDLAIQALETALKRLTPETMKPNKSD